MSTPEGGDVDRDELAAAILRHYCLPLVRKVHEEDPEAWGPWLAAIPVEHLRIVAVLLAALVDVDAPLSELTGWARYRSLHEQQPIERRTP